MPAAEQSTTAPARPAITVAGAPKAVKAKAGILVDAITGQVLWARNATEVRPIASITKVMTALVVLQSGSLTRQIRVPKAVKNYVAKYGANAVGLVAGQVFTVDELLHMMLIESAADAAYTLANAYGPGLPAFIGKMNAEAARLGLTHTHFTSPDGLPYPSETSTYSTPAELVSLGEIAMEYPEFAGIVKLRYYTLKKGNGHGTYSVTSSNELIGQYPGVVGIKTGFTDAAGHTLLFEAVRNGRVLIGDVLGSPPTGAARAPKTPPRSSPGPSPSSKPASQPRRRASQGVPSSPARRWVRQPYGYSRMVPHPYGGDSPPTRPHAR